jgi:hypothetical protein
VIFIDEKSNYYRICPEQHTCDLIAKDKAEFNKILETPVLHGFVPATPADSEMSSKTNFLNYYMRKQ